MRPSTTVRLSILPLPPAQRVWQPKKSVANQATWRNAFKIVSEAAGAPNGESGEDSRASAGVAAIAETDF